MKTILLCLALLSINAYADGETYNFYFQKAPAAVNVHTGDTPPPDAVEVTTAAPPPSPVAATTQASAPQVEDTKWGLRHWYINVGESTWKEPNPWSNSYSGYDDLAFQALTVQFGYRFTSHWGIESEISLGHNNDWASMGADNISLAPTYTPYTFHVWGMTLEGTVAAGYSYLESIGTHEMNPYADVSLTIGFSPNFALKGYLRKYMTQTIDNWTYRSNQNPIEPTDMTGLLLSMRF